MQELESVIKPENQLRFKDFVTDLYKKKQPEKLSSLTDDVVNNLYTAYGDDYKSFLNDFYKKNDPDNLSKLNDDLYSKIGEAYGFTQSTPLVPEPQEEKLTKDELRRREYNGVNPDGTLKPKKEKGFWGSYAGDVIQGIAGQTLNKWGDFVSVPDKIVSTIAGKVAANQFLKDREDYTPEMRKELTERFIDFASDNIVGPNPFKQKFHDVTDEVSKEWSDNSHYYGEKDFKDFISEKKYGSAFGQVMLEGSRSFFNTVENMIVAPASLVATGVSSATDIYDELDSRTDLNEFQKVTNSVVNGSIEALSELLFDIPVAKWLKGIYKTAGKEVAENAVKKGVSAWMEQAMKKYGLLIAPVSEGIEEIANAVGSGITDWATDVDPDAISKIPVNALDGFVYGMAGGTQASVTAIPGIIRNRVQKRKEENEERKVVDYITQTTNQLINPNTGKIHVGMTAANEALFILGETEDGTSYFVTDKASKGQTKKIVNKKDFLSENIIEPKDFITNELQPYIQQKETKRAEEHVQNVIQKQIAEIPEIIETETGQRFRFSGDPNSLLADGGIMASELDENGEPIGPPVEITKEQIDGYKERIQKQAEEKLKLEEDAAKEAERLAKEAEKNQTVTGAPSGDSNVSENVEETGQKVIPVDKDGNPDYDQMEPDMFMSEFGREFGEEEAVKELEGLRKAAQQKIAKLETKREKSTSLNERASILKEIKSLSGNIEKISGVIGKQAEVAKEKQEQRKLTELDNQKNGLVRLIKMYNNKQKRQRTSQETALIMKVASDLGYKIAQDRMGNIVATNKEGKRLIEKSERRVAEMKLDNVDEEYRDIVSTLIPTSEFIRTGLGPKETRQAIDDIKAGKTSVPAQTLLESLQKMAQDGVVTIKGNRETGQPDIDVSVDEYFDSMMDEVTDQEAEFAQTIPDELLYPVLEERYEPTIDDILQAEQLFNEIQNGQSSEETATDTGTEGAGVQETEINVEDGSVDQEPAIQGGLSDGQDLQGRPAEVPVEDQAQESVQDQEGLQGEQVDPDFFEEVQGIANDNVVNKEVRQAEKEVNVNPSEAQKEAGNYKKGHIKVNGFDITIENPKGSTRSGKDKTGKPWSVKLNNAYGYFKRTEGKDGDQIDVFLGDKLNSEKVFVIDQVSPETGKFDEHKVLLGFNTKEDAVSGYRSNYDPSWRGMGAITELSIDDFRQWVKDGKRTKEPLDPGAKEFQRVLSSLQSPEAVKEESKEPEKNPEQKEETDRGKEPWQMTRDEFKEHEKNLAIQIKKDDIIKSTQKDSQILKQLDDFNKNEKDNVYNTGLTSFGYSIWFSIYKGKRKNTYSIVSQYPEGTGFYKPQKSISNATSSEVIKFINDNTIRIYTQGTYLPYGEYGHEDFIQQAIDEGKPVPKEVLNDYPELKIQTTSKTETPEKLSGSDNILSDEEGKVNQIGKETPSEPANKENIPDEMLQKSNTDAEQSLQKNETPSLSDLFQIEESPEEKRIKEKLSSLTLAQRRDAKKGIDDIDTKIKTKRSEIVRENGNLKTARKTASEERQKAGTGMFDENTINSLPVIQGHMNRISQLQKEYFDLLKRKESLIDTAINTAKMQGDMFSDEEQKGEIEETEKQAKSEANKGKTKLELMNEAKNEKILNKQLNYEGNIKTRKQFIEESVRDGKKFEIGQENKIKDVTRSAYNRMNGREQEEFDRRQKEAGLKNVYKVVDTNGTYYEITKAEYDYAILLLSQQPAPVEKQEVSTEPTPVSTEPTDLFEEIKGVAEKRKQDKIDKMFDKVQADQKKFREDSQKNFKDNWEERDKERQEENKKDFGKSNTTFTEDAAKAAIERLNKSRGNLNAGIDPQSMVDMVTVSGFYIEGGARKFADFANQMIETLGEWVKPYLKGLYENIRRYPGMETISKDMDSTQVVDEYSFDAKIASENPFIDDIKSNLIKSGDVYEIEYENIANTKFKDIVRFNDFDGTLISFTETKTGKRGALMLRDIISSKFVKKGNATDSKQGLIDSIKQRIADNEWISSTPRLTALANNAGFVQGKDYADVKELYDIASYALNEYFSDNAEQFNPQGKTAQQVKEIVKTLNQKMNLLPTETTRSADQVEKQQFSTPPAFAFVANWAAQVNQNDTVLEPSAGEGNIAVFAKNAGANVVVNEIDKKRSSLLSKLFSKVLNEDAKHLHAIAALKNTPVTTVVMNPPFSRDIAMGNKLDIHAAEKHIEAALNKLEDGGRLVAIVGRGMSMDSPTHRSWFDKIGQKYNVKANILVSGDAYSKKGTNFDNRLIVIDKNGETFRNEVLTGEANDYSQLVDLVSKVTNKEKLNYDEINNRTSSKGKTSSTTNTSVQTGQQPGSANDVPVGGRGRGNAGQTEIGGLFAQPVDATNTGGGSVSRNKPATSGTTATTEKRGINERIPDTSTTSRSIEPETGQLPDTKIGELKVSRQEKKLNDSGDVGYDQYVPEITIEGSKPHPTKLVESTAMASVSLPEVDYTPQLPIDKINEGALSDAQLEDVILAGNSHKQVLPDGKRRGFFLGAGTGYGKGRTIAAIILDNWNQGRKKAVWISKNDKAHYDSADYWEAVGGDPKVMFEQKSGTTPIAPKEGVLLSKYGTLSNKFDKRKDYSQNDSFWTEKPQNRLQQMAQWLGKDFDGVIVFDESHKMANAKDSKGARGSKKASSMALAGLELQRLLPNARVVYSSATGATEVTNLVYAQRLGLWGDGTPFSQPGDFIQAVENSGVAGMELISRDLKAMGLYTAKTLSFDGVQYDTVTHDLMPEQKKLYDKVARAWQKVLENINDAIEENNTGKNAKSAAMSAFWGAHQRFFSNIIITMQMPSLLNDIQENLANDKAIVVQLVNTNEAATKRALAEAKSELEEGEEVDYDEMDVSPKQSLIEFLRKSFPVALFETTIDENGNEIQVMVRDSEGNPVENPVAVKRRDNLIAEIDREIQLPEAPLDILINTFGAENVAEITGRSSRIVAKQDESGNYKKVEESRTNSSVAADKDAFMDVKKNILVFSDAGGTGASFHSDLKRKNQKQRVHYVLQAGWRADGAVQGFGRSHRSNQAVPPIFKLVTTNLKAQRRFLSSIARRLDQLGALTKGQRQTGGQGILDGSFNLEGEYAKQALFNFYVDVENGKVDCVDMNTLEKQMALKIYVEDDGGSRKYNDQVVFNTKMFLNRLMSLEVDLMDDVFEGFMNRLEEEINIAKTNGTYDEGIEVVKALSTKVVDEQEIYSDEKTGAKTYITTIELEVTNEKTDFDSIVSRVERYGNKFKGFFREEKSGRIYALVQQDVVRADGERQTKYRRFSVVADSFIEPNEFYGKYQRVDEPVARESWNKEFSEYPNTRKKTEYIVKGLILPVWNRLPEKINVKRYVDNDGNAHLGRSFSKKDIEVIRSNFEVASSETYTADKLVDVLNKGGYVKLSNGFEFTKKSHQGNTVFNIANTNPYRDRERLTRAGASFVVKSSMSMSGDFVVPAANASEVIQSIIEMYNAPAIEVEDSEGNHVMGERSVKAVNKPHDPNVSIVRIGDLFAVEVKRNLDYKTEYEPIVKPLLAEHNGEWDKRLKKMMFQSNDDAQRFKADLNSRIFNSNAVSEPDLTYDKASYTQDGRKGLPEGLTFASEASLKNIPDQQKLWDDTDYTPGNSDTIEDSVLAERVMEELNGINFQGSPLTGAAKIKNGADVAFLFKNLESAATENAFAVLIKPNGSYKVLWLSHGGTAGVLVDAKLIIAAAKEYGANRVTFVHNHPSGNLQPSAADMQMWKKLDKALTAIGVQTMPGVIINLDSGKYAEFDDYNSPITSFREKENDKAKPVKVYSFDRQKLYVPSMSRSKISSSEDAAIYLSKMKRGLTPKIGALILNRKNEVVSARLYDETLTADELASNLLYDVSKYGEEVILHSNSKINHSTIVKTNNALKLIGSQILDVIQGEQDQDILKAYKSFANEGLLSEPNGEYGNEVNDPEIRFRKVSPEGYYSTVENALEQIKQEKGTSEQMKAMILKNGAKQAELDWMGWDEQFPDVRKMITKADIQKWIDQNKVEVEEVVKGKADADTKLEINQNSKGEYYVYDLARAKKLSPNYKTWQEASDFLNSNKANPNDVTKFSNYVLPGGENYKELLLTMPTDTSANIQRRKELAAIDRERPLTESEQKEYDSLNAKTKGDQSTFKSSHFDEPNILAHVRFNEREANGERVLFIEEWQADKGQEWQKLKKLIDSGKATQADIDRFNFLDKNFPFNKTSEWLQLAMRRMMRYAAENGFDRIAWTNGEQQADRYDLSEHVDDIYTSEYGEEWTNRGSEKRKDVEIFLKGGEVKKLVVDDSGKIVSGDYVGERLENVIGKEITEKILSANIDTNFGQQDLKVGGEGMKAFYDGIVPSAASKLGKPFGAKIEPIQIDVKPEIVSDEGINMETGEVDKKFIEGKYAEVQSIPVTESMRESVMQGVPLFKKVQTVNETTEKNKEVFDALQEIQSLAGNALPLVAANNRVEIVKAMEENGARKDFINLVKNETFVAFVDTSTGHVYVDMSKVRNRDEAIKTWLHENGGHFGIRNLIPDRTELNEFFDILYDSVLELAKTNPLYRKVVEEVESIYGDISKREAADEFFAHLAEKVNQNEVLTPAERSIWQKLVEGVRNILSKVFKFDGKLLTHHEISNMVRAAIQTNFQQNDRVQDQMQEGGGTEASNNAGDTQGSYRDGENTGGTRRLEPIWNILYDKTGEESLFDTAENLRYETGRGDKGNKAELDRVFDQQRKYQQGSNESIEKPSFDDYDNIVDYAVALGEWMRNQVRFKKELPLSQKEFEKKYKGQHKDIRTKQNKWDYKNTLLEIQKTGFNSGAWVLPLYKGGIPTNIIESNYGNKKGDIIYLVPNEWIKDTNAGWKIKDGWKPKNEDVVQIEYDNQSSYEAYINSKIKFPETFDPDNGDIRFKKQPKYNETVVKSATKIRSLLEKGQSNYFNVEDSKGNTVKIRVSDHSANKQNNVDEKILSFVTERSKQRRSAYNQMVNEWAIQDNGLTDTYEEIEDILSYELDFDDIRFKKTPSSFEQNPEVEGALIKKPSKTTIKEISDGIRDVIQDRDLKIRRFIEEIGKRGGKMLENAYRDKTLAFGRAETLHKQFDKQLVNPIIEVLKAFKKAGITNEGRVAYTVAKHAPERNAKIRKEKWAEWEKVHKNDYKDWQKSNPEVTDAEDKEAFDRFEKEKQDKFNEIQNADYSGVNSLNKNEKIGPDEFARQQVKLYEKMLGKETVDAYWKALKEANKFTLDRWLAANMINKKEYDEMLTGYENYVPLKGWWNDKAKEIDYHSPMGAGKSLHHAEGRKTMPDDPIASLMHQAFKSISEQVENEVKQSMLKFMVQNMKGNEDIVNIKRIYYVQDPVSGDWNYTTEKPAKDAVDTGIAKTVYYTEHFRERKPGNAKEHEVVVDTPDGTFIMVFDNKWTDVGRALNNTNNLVLGLDSEISNKFLGSTIGKFTNLQKMLFTSWNIVFPLTNFSRDIPEAFTHIMISRGAAQAGRFTKDVPLAFITASKYLAGGKFEPKYDVNGKPANRDAHYKDWLEIGGMTGFTHQKDTEQLQKEIKRRIKRMGSFSIDDVTKAAETFSEIFENTTRFAAYLSGVESGMSKKDAALLSKEVSVNFNRKGKMSKSFDSVYAFFNAAMQGATKGLKLAKDYPVKFAAAATVWTTMGFIVAELNRYFDDDDEDEFENLNKYVRMNYLTFPIGDGKYGRIPLPQFWRAFYAIGSNLSDYNHNKQSLGMALGQSAGNLANALLPIDVAGLVDEDGSLNISPVVPTAVKPLVEAYVTNRNFMNYPIAHEAFTKDLEQRLASHKLHKKNVNPAIKFITDGIAELAGADSKYKYYYTDGRLIKGVEPKQIPGIFDINPSKVEHLITAYSGGTGKFLTDLITTGYQVVSPTEEVKQDNMPYVNAFIRKYPEVKYAKLDEYRRMVERNKRWTDIAKDKKGTSQDDEFMNIMTNDIYRRESAAIKVAKKQIEAAKKRVDNGNITVEEFLDITAEIKENAINRSKIK